MKRNKRMLVLVTTLVVMATATSACEIDILPLVDCSGINQPDMGGLVCLGLNGIALNVILALLAAVLGGLGAAIPV